MTMPTTYETIPEALDAACLAHANRFGPIRGWDDLRGTILRHLESVAKPQPAAVGDDAVERAAIRRCNSMNSEIPSAWAKAPESVRESFRQAFRADLAAAGITPAPSAPAKAVELLREALRGAEAEMANSEQNLEGTVLLEWVKSTRAFLAGQPAAEAQAVEVTDEMVEAVLARYHGIDWPDAYDDVERGHARIDMRAALTAFLATQPTEASK